MIGLIKDQTTVMLGIVITGLEETFIRCTMVHRDELFRWLDGKDDLDADGKLLQRRIWATSAFNGQVRSNLSPNERHLQLTQPFFTSRIDRMYHEFVAVGFDRRARDQRNCKKP